MRLRLGAGLCRHSNKCCFPVTPAWWPVCDRWGGASRGIRGTQPLAGSAQSTPYCCTTMGRRVASLRMRTHL